MDEFIKRRGLDLLSVIAASTVPLGLWLRFRAIDNNHLILIMGILFSLIAIPCRENLPRFIRILIISVVISNIIMTAFLGAAAGYIVLFYFANAFNIGKGAFIGFIFVKAYYFLVGRRVSSSINRVVLALIFITAFITAAIFIANTTKSDIKSTDETLKKSEFIQRITIAIGKNQLTQFTNKELIDLGITSDIYTNNGEQILNGYGGRFYIEKQGQNVDLVFEDIPAKEECYRFYYINAPDIYGFKMTKIDGVIEAYPETSTAAIESFKKKVCYSGKEKVTIEFIGSIDDIVMSSRYWIK